MHWRRHSVHPENFDDSKPQFVPYMSLTNNNTLITPPLAMHWQRHCVDPEDFDDSKPQFVPYLSLDRIKSTNELTCVLRPPRDKALDRLFEDAEVPRRILRLHCFYQSVCLILN